MLRTLGAVTALVSAALAAVVLILTGLVGYQPVLWPVDAAKWGRGVWTGQMIAMQVAAGIALLFAACLAAVRVVPRFDPRPRVRRRH